MHLQDRVLNIHKLLIFIFAFLILTKFNIDPDFGWHFAIGEKFLETGAIIRQDQFSWTMPGFEWGNSVFAYQILVAVIFQNFGHLATSAFFGIIASLAVLILLPKKLDFWKLLVLGLGVTLATFNLGVRPHTVSFLLFSLLLVLLDKKIFTKRAHLLVWFIFFVVWANFHEGFVAGLVVLAGFLFLDFIWRVSCGEKPSWLPQALCILAGFLGTLLTPFPLRLWQSEVFFDLTSPENLTSIAEWQPTVIYFPHNIFFAASGLVFVYIFAKNVKVAHPAWFLISAALFALSFLAVNFVFFWTAAFIFIASRTFDLKLDLKNFWLKLPLISSTLAIFLIILLTFVKNLSESFELRKRLISDNYPVEATQFLTEKKLTTGLFNDYNWGGYLTWQAPNAKVFANGRMASWRTLDGTSILSDYLKITRGDCAVAAKYDIRILLVGKDFKNACFENFTQIYQDSVAKILVKRPT